MGIAEGAPRSAEIVQWGNRRSRLTRPVFERTVRGIQPLTMSLEIFGIYGADFVSPVEIEFRGLDQSLTGKGDRSRGSAAIGSMALLILAKLIWRGERGKM